MVTSVSDTFFLKRALQLAARGRGFTNPNPMVGAVIVKNNRIIGEGYHHKVGAAHAEIEALNHARRLKNSVKDATLYVTLEPCSHQGRQPPCAPSVITAGIKRVVICTSDPNPKVAGRGIDLLKKQGIKVEVGLLAAEAKRLNEAFFSYHEKKRPFVAIKFASSLDGKIATRTHDSKWITNEAARFAAHALRATYQGIVVGIETVVRDNPHLGVRNRKGRDPLRIILDSTLRLPLNSQVLRNTNVIVATTTSAPSTKLKKLKQQGITVLQFPGRQVPLQNLLKKLYTLEILSVLVEGGGTILGSFCDEQLVDKAYIFHAPVLIGGSSAISALAGEGVKSVSKALRLKNIIHKNYGDNLLTIGDVG